MSIKFSRRRRLVLSVVVGLGCTFMAACGGDTHAKRRHRIGEAADRTTSAKSTKLTYDIRARTGLGATSQSLRIWFEGRYDFVRREGVFEVDLSSLRIRERAELRVFDSTTYMRIGAGMGVDRPWVQADLGSLSGAGAAGVGSPASGGGLTSLDPRSAILYLHGITGKVEDIGEEEVRGDTTTHYKATVNLAEAADRFPAPIASQLRKLRTTFPIEVWVDTAGYVRRIAYTIDLESLPPPTTGPPPTGEITARQELFGFGVAVGEVERPRPDEVMTVAELHRRLQQQQQQQQQQQGDGRG